MSVSTEINPSSQKIAVVVPAYNCEGLIEETLQSIATQSRPADEVWIVNDGSTDGTAAVVERFIFGREGWHLLNKVNGGVSSARNAGVRAAASSWIAFVDSDDLWRSDHLRSLMQEAQQSVAAIIVSGVEVFEQSVDQILFTFYLNLAEIDGFPRNLFLRNNIVPSAVLMNRAAFLELGGYDEEKEIQHAEDWDLWFRALRQGLSFHFTGKATVLYRRHASNATANLVKSQLVSVHCLKKNLELQPMYPDEMKQTLSFFYRRLANEMAAENRSKAGEYYRAAIVHGRRQPLNYVVWFMHVLHAMPLYRALSRLWLSCRLAFQRK